MKSLRNAVTMLVLIACTTLGCTPETPAPTPIPEKPTTPKPDKDTPPPPANPGTPQAPNTPVTSIPDELVGTWYADGNHHPMTEDWEKGTFQGEPGNREYRTMVFTKEGNNAIEYFSYVYSSCMHVMFKRIRTLEYKNNPPRSLTFHQQTGRVRIFEGATYQEIDLVDEKWDTYLSVLEDPEATTYTSSPNFLRALRATGSQTYSVKYHKVEGTTTPGNPTSPGGLYSPPRPRVRTSRLPTSTTPPLPSATGSGWPLTTPATVVSRTLTSRNTARFTSGWT